MPSLAAKGIRVGCKRVARLMTQAGLAGVSRRKFVVTTVKDGGRQAPDLVERNFIAEAPHRLWVADITYLPTWAGFLYLAVVLDAFSRRIVGWSMATSLARQLVIDALNMALMTRRPSGVIHHSDQGSQGEFKWSSQHDPGNQATLGTDPAASRLSAMLAAQPGKDSAVLGLVQDEPALRSGAASGILDKPCARRSAGGKIGSEEWVFLISPRNGNLDLGSGQAAIAPRPEATRFSSGRCLAWPI
jgi:hypothetical protein